MRLPPGPLYIFQSLPRVILPPTVAYATLRIAYFETVPVWASLAISALSLPVTFFVGNVYTYIADYRAAASRGASLPPEVEDKWPGGLTIVAALVKNLSSGYPLEVFLDWTRQYGNTFAFSVMFERRMFTTEPEYIKAILATDFGNFHKGPQARSAGHTLLGTGVFNSDGDRWKFHRAATRPYFTKERIQHVDIFDKHAADMLNQAADRLHAGVAVDFQDMVSRFTMDSATEFLFNNNVASLSAGLRYPETHPKSSSPDPEHPADTFAHAFAEAQNLTAERGRRGIWPLFEFWTDAVQKHRDVVNQFIDPILDQALSKKALEQSHATEKGTPESDDGDESFLDHLVKLTDDKDIIRDSILNVIVAGRDTTAATLTFAVSMLCEHPDILRRLRQEILDTVGPVDRPENDNIREMKYLRAFINETLRLYPAVPANSRTSKEATVWPSTTPGGLPVYVPANTRVVYSVFLMHRRTDLWGPDALAFDPDRFLDDRVKQYLTPKPFIFLPFNAGSRICLGQQFAYHEMSFFLVRLLQRFTGFSLAPDVQPEWSKPPAEWADCVDTTKATDKVQPASHLTMFVRGGLWIRMTEASLSEGGI